MGRERRDLCVERDVIVGRERPDLWVERDVIVGRERDVTCG